MKTTFELVLDLTNRIFTEREDHKVATILRLAADKIEEGGICPAGVHGGTLGEAGYWVVHTGRAPGEGPQEPHSEAQGNGEGEG